MKMTTITAENILPHMKIVMDGLEKINYNLSHHEQNSISLFKNSYNGMKLIQDDNPRLKIALGMWLGIIENKLLNINNDSYQLFESLPTDDETEWLKSLVTLKNLSQT